MHSSQAVQNQDIKQVCDWIKSQRVSQIAVSTTSAIAKALSLDPGFKSVWDKKLRHWLNPFLNCWRLSFQMSTRFDQKLIGHLISVRKSFENSLIKKCT